jgi:aspartyl/asparaginyl beta-hydroxylase (cupin superfamily)
VNSKLRAIVHMAGVSYIRVMDKLISAYIGGDRAPAFFDAAKTWPAVTKVDQNYGAILQELNVVLRQRQSIRSVHETLHWHPDIEGWRVLSIYFYGMRDQFPNQKLFPETVAVLDQIPNLVDGWFSILEPGKSIVAHRGTYRGFLRYHTAFKVPENNPPHIRVKDQFYTWKEGESVMFDDRHEHEVYNNSDDVRVVLITDVLRPLPWFLHYPNVLATIGLGRLFIRPAIKNKTLDLKADLLDVA